MSQRLSKSRSHSQIVFISGVCLNFPIPRRAIQHNSANVHIIPGNKQVSEKIQDIEEGDLIQLSGHLVNVTGNDGWRWRSSTSFTDTGNGACELLFLDEVTVLN